MELNILPLLKDLISDDPAVRKEAEARLRKHGADAIAPLGAVMNGDDKAMAKAAKKALEDIAHYVARPGAKTSEAEAVAEKLLVLTDARLARPVRAHALFLLGFAGSDKNVPAIARLQSDSSIGEDARMVLERINTKAAKKAMKPSKTTR